MQRGESLPAIRKEVTRPDILKYAEASGDYNPIHVDEEFAAKTPFGGVIAHGYLTLGYVSQMMVNAFGDGWIRLGGLQVRFLAPVKPGDVIETSGQVVDEVEDGSHRFIVCDIECTNQRGESVLVGQARAPL